MIHFYCLACGRKFQVKEEFAGRSTRCPTCKGALQVPQPEATEAKIPIARLVVADDATAEGERAGALASVTVTYQTGGDRSVEELLTQDGQERGRYVIDHEIARGGMGAVLRGIDRDIRRDIAIKVMLDDFDPHKKSRFVEEAQITGQLEHPNIVPVHELGLDNQRRPFFTMKLVKGRSLEEILKKPGAVSGKDWSLGRLLTILVNICHAMGYAHARKVIHRDLKPANIMVGDFGEVYVMDWGLAKVLSKAQPAPTTPLIFATTFTTKYLPKPPSEPVPSVSDSGRVSTSRQEDADLTQDGAILGTPAYMAPEQALGRVPDIDQRTDIYALGGILYVILTREPPVEKGGGQAALLARVARGEIKQPHERTPTRLIPPELSAIAMKALAKEPDDRYQTVEAFRRDLELYLEGRSVSAKQDNLKEQVWKLINRNKGASIATAAGLLILLMVVGLFLRINYTARVQAELARTNADDNYAAFQEAVRKSVPAFVKSAHLAAEQRDFAQARYQVEAALTASPGNADARLLKAQLLTVAQDFPAATAELQQYLLARPGDQRSRRLLNLCRQARPGDVDRLLPIAGVLVEQEAPALVDGLLRKYGKNSNAARQVLLTMYRKRIEKAWPGKGNLLTIDAKGLHLNMKYQTDLTDLSPLKGMPLDSLICDHTPVTDLTPLKGMPLTSLICYWTKVADLTPLKGMPLTSLHFGATFVTDLSPLADMPLTTLSCSQNTIADLSPLRGMPLTSLTCFSTRVTDLAPLIGMKLVLLDCSDSPVADLSPLTGMPLLSLKCFNTQVADLSPLKKMKLTELRFTPRNITRGLDVVRNIPTLRTISPDNTPGLPAAEFWDRLAKKEFAK